MLVCLVPRKCLKLLCILGEQKAIFAALLGRGRCTNQFRPFFFGNYLSGVGGWPFVGKNPPKNILRVPLIHMCLFLCWIFSVKAASPEFWKCDIGARRGIPPTWRRRSTLGRLINQENQLQAKGQSWQSFLIAFGILHCVGSFAFALLHFSGSHTLCRLICICMLICNCTFIFSHFTFTGSSGEEFNSYSNSQLQSDHRDKCRAWEV